jgi:hypothetical protein
MTTKNENKRSKRDARRRAGVLFEVAYLLAAAVLISLTICGTDTWAEIADTSGYFGDSIPEYVIIEGDIMVKRELLGTKACYDYSFWPSGVVPYTFSLNVSPTNQQLMLDAMAEWERVANVNFVPRDNANHPDYIYILDASANSSAVGMQGGIQPLKINNWGKHFTIVHELGHALGYWHEQSRPDRDDFVIIHESNIKPGKDSNFVIHSGAGHYGPYDFESIMHYGKCAFSICGEDCPVGCETITCQPDYAHWESVIGNRDYFSHFDTLTMGFLYPQDDYEFVSDDAGYLQYGTFLLPWEYLSGGLEHVPEGGTLWIITPGDYTVFSPIDKPMTIRAPLGGAMLIKGE